MTALSMAALGAVTRFDATQLLGGGTSTMEQDLLVTHCGACGFEDGSLLSGICAQPTMGYNAFVFMALIELIIKSQCPISDPCRRVKSLRGPDAKELSDDEYDFVVVGGGVAGTVIASRLSEDPKSRVLLLEAGAEEPSISSVPAFAFTAANSSYDWQFETVPQKRACLGNGGVCLWPRGKMLCGTACLSGLMYTRGHRSIYDGWAVRNKGWSYDEVLRHFKKSENNSEPADEIEKEFHGFDGPLSVSRFPYQPDLATDILDAAKELGLRVGDPNGRQQQGFTVAPIMVKDGVLASPNKMYLRPVLHRGNLRVLIDSYATTVNVDKTGSRAEGVEFRDKWGNQRRVKARKEVILAGGVVGSAQLLLLSGVGPAAQLRALNVTSVRDLPVGENLHYHVGFSIVLRMEGKNTNSMTIESLHEFVTNRTGPFTSTGLTQVTGFFASKYSANGVPDIQLYLDGYSAKCRNRENMRETSDISFRPIYLLSKCRGTIRLRSADPYDKPLIDPNYLCDEVEVDALIEAVKLVHNLTETKVLRDRVKRFDIAENRRCAHLRQQRDVDEYWRCVIKEYTNGENHHAGTCKMGPAGDPTAVVDNQLRVHGIPNLRVADASIFPTPINCNTIAPTVMVGEKAADMIKETWSGHV